MSSFISLCFHAELTPFPSIGQSCVIKETQKSLSHPHKLLLDSTRKNDGSASTVALAVAISVVGQRGHLLPDSNKPDLIQALPLTSERSWTR